MLRALCLLALIYQDLIDHFFDKVVLLINDILLVAPVHDPLCIHRMPLQDRLVLFQHLDRMPAHIFHLRLAGAELLDDGVDLVLDDVIVHHGVLTVVIVLMPRLLRMMVDERPLLRIFLVMGDCMHQDLQAAAFARRHRDRRDAQHLRETVQVDLHAPLFHHVHHIERQHHRLAKLNELQRQVQVPLQAGRIHHIHDHIHLVAHDALAGHLLLHRIGGQAVDARKRPAFFLLHGHARPVRHFQIRPRVGVEQRRFSAVRVADEPDVDHLSAHTAASFTKILSAMRRPNANRVPRNFTVMAPFLSLLRTVI